MRHEFVTPEAPRLRVAIPGGRIEIETDDVSTTIVDVDAIRGDLGDLKVEQHGRRIMIEMKSKLFSGGRDAFDIQIRAPHGADVYASTASATLHATGRLRGIELKTASGRLEVAGVDHDAKISSASGNVRLGTVGRKAEVHTASGDVEIESVGAGGTFRSASGDVRLGEVANRVTVQTASGDLSVRSIAEGVVDAKSVSGDVLVGIRPGSRLQVDARSLSGETSSEVALGSGEVTSDGPLVSVKVVTVSGDVRIVRA